LLFVPALAAEKRSALQLIDLAKSNGADLRDAITASFDAKDLKEGTAWAGTGTELLLATEAASNQRSSSMAGPARPCSA